PRVHAARRLLHHPDRRGTHRRHHPVAEDRAHGRGLQHADLPALPDGAAHRPVRRRAQLSLGRAHPPARPDHEEQDEGGEGLRLSLQDAGAGHRMGLEGNRKTARGSTGGVEGGGFQRREKEEELGMRARTAAVAGLALSLLWAGWAWAQEASPVGLWRTIDDKTKKERSLIRITESNGELQGVVEKIFDQSGDDPEHLCRACKGDRKDKPVIGMTILWGLKKDGE